VPNRNEKLFFGIKKCKNLKLSTFFKQKKPKLNQYFAVLKALSSFTKRKHVAMKKRNIAEDVTNSQLLRSM
jgi:hypothetical protein